MNSFASVEQSKHPLRIFTPIFGTFLSSRILFSAGGKPNEGLTREHGVLNAGRRPTAAHTAQLYDPYVLLVANLYDSSRSRGLLPTKEHLPLHIETQRAAEQGKLVVHFRGRVRVDPGRFRSVVLV
jgi:hypothetical protein